MTTFADHGTRHVLVTGSTGQVGRALTRHVWPQGWHPVALDRQMLDLGDADIIARVIATGYAGAPWAAVINAAAFTNVDQAEADVVSAWRLNALAPAVMAASCRAANLPMIQVSTDYVFAGDREGAWEVDDNAQPLGVYGASKLGGEMAVRTSGARHAVVRTAWLFSPHGRNFVKTMLHLAEAHEEISVVADQRGSPTSAVDLAGALVTIATRLASDREIMATVLHFTNQGTASWAEFATEIFRQSTSRGGPRAAVRPIATSDFPTRAKRPRNSVLSTDKIDRDFGFRPRPWRDALEDTMNILTGPMVEDRA